MLVDNKFFYISLPRCASTAFQISCVKQNINIQHVRDFIDNAIELVDKSWDIQTLKNHIPQYQSHLKYYVCYCVRNHD